VEGTLTISPIHCFSYRRSPADFCGYWTDLIQLRGLSPVLNPFSLFSRDHPSRSRATPQLSIETFILPPPFRGRLAPETSSINKEFADRFVFPPALLPTQCPRNITRKTGGALRNGSLFQFGRPPAAPCLPSYATNFPFFSLCLKRPLLDFSAKV